MPSSSGSYLQVIGRLSEETTLSEAQIQVDAINASVAAAQGREHPEERRPVLVSLYDTLVDDVRGWMLLVLWAVGLVMLVACVIGAAGVYAVMASVVAQRQRELGVRIALGATRGRIARDVLARAGAYLAAGLIAGLLAGRALSGLFASLLFAVEPTDLSIYVSVAGLLLAVGLLAAGLPASRAARADPVVALRSD